MSGMTPEHDTSNDADEAALRALFDETAQPPDPQAIQRMARAAAQIPELHRPWYQKLWSRPYAAMGLAAAAAAALIIGIQDPTPPDPSAGRTAGLPTAGLSAAGLPTSTASVEDTSLDELLAFELTDNGDDEVAALDADPFTGWDEDGDTVDDHPAAALDVLYGDDFSDIELLGSAFDDVLTEGG